MRRITVILLVLLYLVPSIGVTVSTHYCGGRVTSVSIKFLDNRHKCPCGSKKMKKGCCKDEASYFKLSDEQQKTQKLSCAFVKINDHQPPVSNQLSLFYETPLLLQPFNHTTHPPDIFKPPLYIRHCVFLI